MNADRFKNFTSKYLNFGSTLHWLHQNRELKRFSDFFDTIETHPLTDLQKRAVILNEKRNLVVAGAGTGKTSVIIAKAGYLIKSGFCKPEEILLLAFNDPAAKELQERCAEKLNANVNAKTFHSLGKKVLDDAECRKSKVSQLATNKDKFEKFLTSFIIDLRNNPKTWKKFKSFIVGKLKPYKPEDEFKTLLEYRAYVKNVELRALSGDLVKSFAELDIANFLFMNGVNFKYEAQYKHSKIKYQPDFYLTDYDVYLEHFGIGRDGSTAPYIDAQTYQEQMKWKRELHKKKNTELLETYSWQRFEGDLLQSLNRILKKSGVKYNPRPDDDIFKSIIKNNYTNQIGNLLKVFLAHFKSNHMTIEELNNNASSIIDDGRSLKFIELFELFHQKYEDELASRGDEIDFNDMIAKATQHILEGNYEPQWKYIIVDEFQDISIDRFNFVEALLKSNKDASFFAVGDDWQSINRFAGSDISIMSRFRDFFGKSEIVNLDRTFRFNDRIANVSGEFIQKNPNQIRKNLVTQTYADEAQVFLHAKTSSDDNIKKLRSVLSGIVQADKVKNETLLVLGRYNHLINKADIKKTIEQYWSGTVLEPQSIHRSKGKEADYVIVLGMDASQFGFPSEITDDPLLSLVLAEPDDYPHAEERRLFYVAITRAKKQAHLIYDEKSPSVFITELIDENYDVHYLKKENEFIEMCPECKSGEIVNNGNGFYACSNFPFCKYEAPSCEACSEEHMMAPPQDSAESHYKCASDYCDNIGHSCPKCDIGMLRKKSGEYGEFWSCHIWPRCSYTKSIKNTKAS